MHIVKPKPIALGALLLFLCGMLGSCAAVERSSSVFAYTPVKNGAVYDAPETPGNAYAATEGEKNALAQMELKLENDHLALYLGRVYYDIAVVDKATGSIWFSNPAIVEQDPKRDEGELSRSIAFSQLSIQYYDNKNVSYTMYSMPDAADGEAFDQITVEETDGALTVTYKLGLDAGDLVYCQVMTEAAYNELSEKGNTLAEEGALAFNVLGNFLNAYNPVDFASLSADEQTAYKKKYPSIEEIGVIYESYSSLSDVQKERLQTFYQAVGWTKEQVDEQEKALMPGGRENGQTASFTVPLSYSLDGRDLLVTVDTKAIVCAKGFYLDRVSVLPAFGGVKEGKGGYMFLPDGSGSILNGRADAEENSGQSHSVVLPFYGPDVSKILSQQSSLSNAAPFPLFGNTDERRGFLAVVESGDAAGGARAESADVNSSYNRVYGWFTYIENDTIASDGSKLSADTKVFSPKAMDIPYVTRYHFLYGENCGYSGMARYYQRYLEQTGAISRLTDTASLLSLNVLGAVKREGTLFGVPMTVTERLTTFEQAGDIAQTLYDAGIRGADIQYEGWMTGGVSGPLPVRVAPEKKLGGESGFAALTARLEGLGFSLYPAADLAVVYADGNGFKGSRDAARSLNKSFAFLAPYSAMTGYKQTLGQGLLISPSRYEDIAKNFLDSYRKLAYNKVAVSSMGSVLGSDYNEAAPVLREASKQHTVSALQELKDASLDIRLEGANSYALPYAQKLTGVPLQSGHNRMERISIPFVSMVLHGYKQLTGTPLNLADDYATALLYAVESGAGLHYRLMYSGSDSLRDTGLDAAFPISKDSWLPAIVEQYQRYETELGDCMTQRITKHEQVTQSVHRITYENGVRVLVNYRGDDVTVDGVLVKALDYTVLKG